VPLNKYQEKPGEITDIVTDGDFVHVIPNQHAKTIPPDNKLRDIITKEDLSGIIVIDEDWYFGNSSTKSLACYAHITILNSYGRVLYHGKPGIYGDGDARYTTMFKDFSSILTLGLAGSISSKDVQNALRQVNKELGQSIAKRIRKFLKSN